MERSERRLSWIGWTGLLSSKSGPKEGEPNSGGPSREPRVNSFNERRTGHMDPTRGRGQFIRRMPQGVIQHGARTVERVQRGTGQTLERTTNAKHTCDWEKRFWQHGAYKPEEESHGPSGKRSW